MSHRIHTIRCRSSYRQTRTGLWAPAPALSMVPGTLPRNTPFRLYQVPTGYLMEIRGDVENGELVRSYRARLYRSRVWPLLTWAWGVDPETEPELTRRHFPADKPAPVHLIPELEQAGLLLPL